ncbi:hypothetical protein D3273_23595 [Lichenibacterium minor]|uniref:Uncharacterized protein n=1 Tax=Lichenibacterium minor TaxID=2316528 RepID=A0A4Q2U3Q3_9HYPH|nr:hypothetical protein [Lichenibacterium minor]RYC29517.1 hypothetical protein D3273_23595 [Lichenibacterium minor]
MRRIAFALVLIAASGWAAPSQAQWWGGGWQRPCFGGCGPPFGGGGRWRPDGFVVWGAAPRATWDGSGEFAPRGYGPGRWGWRRMMWRREMRRRRFEAWSRGAERDAEAMPRGGPQPRNRRWIRRWSRWPGSPPGPGLARRWFPGDRVTSPGADDAVAASGALRGVQSATRATVPMRLTAATMLRRPVARPARPDAVPATVAVHLPAASPREAAPRPHRGMPDEPLTRPMALTSQPAARPSAATVAPLAVSTPVLPAGTPPADVPVAPLD